MKSKKYHSVGTVQKHHFVGTFKKYHFVGTVQKYHTVGTVQKYHSVGTVQKYHSVGTVKKYHSVGTVQKSDRKIDENANSISLTYKYMTAHFPGLEQALIKISFIQINKHEIIQSEYKFGWDWKTSDTFTNAFILEYLCHKWPLICSVCHNHNSVFPSFMSLLQ